MTSRRSFIIAVAAASLSASAFGQGYPNKPIRLVVPYAAGGVSDIMGRALAQKLGELIGQPMIVENRAGAAGALGTDATAKSAPDGYTIVLSSLTAYAIAPNMNKSVTYDPVKDFSAIGGVAIAPNILTVSATAPFNSLKELVEYAKANPGKLTFGSSGVGSIGHLSGEVLRTSVGAQMLHVPYKSAGVAYPDMFAGNVSMVFDTLPSAIQHIRSGKAKPIAVLSDKRSALLPDVPTFAEAGFPEATLRFWFGLHGPAHMAAPVVQKLNQTLNHALAAPDLRERFSTLGADPYPTTPQQLTDLVRADMEKLAKTIKAAGIARE
ncbi:MAG TPA: tripartite tricarboxylate transporter substrate binding protein [Burkholderiales bacterium]|jgi:tripartite-type tricarboxylate transporter receptor subunit TctC|nr:tripartite tricarboxylate transporter substrate binding protein [Burkholderiales bacterium]